MMVPVDEADEADDESPSSRWSGRSGRSGTESSSVSAGSSATGKGSGIMSNLRFAHARCRSLMLDVENEKERLEFMLDFCPFQVGVYTVSCVDPSRR